ncbi:IS256 family transposase [Pseudobacter ginsenosidimutans]|uniref:Mutator family transposase n=1 Tax=Pseudobacter ginsenosidimutans TaxID=661488 RepID=A0A4Q7MBS3_9BACT|nr:IS256 family transposase [Pseudobacter ginsenosidimutans]QEC42497.1 IS256 family transposase [Pseudobacter ginsenosidimutans]QEC42621.1 IS256 family transposase [Pseudobacter ginsenosidimutans]QEC45336.1 IS256 family transposase [Pseudobacter ginsenosidimutans]RZS63739.1 transposase-like protein [Pseudobacter ginsenosidimutans]
MEKKNFDFESFKKQATSRLKNGESLLGKDGVLTPLLKEFLEGALDGELEAHLEEDPAENNRKNGKGRKQVKTSIGTVDINPPRDRNGSFEPELIPKRHKTLGVDLDRQIIALYARGASYSDIRDHLMDMYGLEASTATISRVTDKILPLIQEWRSRPLERVYPFVWLDAIHYKVRHEGRVVSRAVYCIIGLTQEGYKELLGMYIGENEGAKFWLQVLTDLQNRGLEDIFIACIDNLTGFADAIESVFPKTEVQLCIVHQVRNSQKYLSYKDLKPFMKDLQNVYKATTIELAERSLDQLESNWGERYPKVIESWRKNWPRLSNYFQYNKDVRRIMYTTNIIEGFHRQLRAVTKSKGAFQSEDALMKLLFLVQENICARWNKPVHNWNQTLAQLSIIFSDRLKLNL